MNADDKRREDERESRRILERVARETDPGGVMTRATRHVQDHMSAADVDRSDPIEYWGTRIGRTIGLILAIAMMAWVVVYIVGG